MFGQLVVYVFAPLFLGIAIEVIQYFTVDKRDLRLADRIADAVSYTFIGAAAYSVALGFELRLVAPIAAAYLVARFVDSNRELPTFQTLLYDFSHAGFGAGVSLLVLALAESSPFVLALAGSPLLLLAFHPRF